MYVLQPVMYNLNKINIMIKNVFIVRIEVPTTYI